MPKNVTRALQRGTATQAAIDVNVHRILRAILRVGLLDGPRTPNHALVNSPEHQQLTFEAASKGIVLLKNAGGSCRWTPPRSSLSPSSGRPPWACSTARRAAPA